jgi:hypothetical protein
LLRASLPPPPGLNRPPDLSTRDAAAANPIVTIQVGAMTLSLADFVGVVNCDLGLAAVEKRRPFGAYWICHWCGAMPCIRPRSRFLGAEREKPRCAILDLLASEGTGSP